MAAFEPSEMIARYKERAAAVKRRPLPPVAGEERQMFLQQAQSDFLRRRWKMAFWCCALTFGHQMLASN